MEDPDHVAGLDMSKRLAELPKLSDEEIRARTLSRQRPGWA